MVLWSSAEKSTLLIELTVPYESALRGDVVQIITLGSWGPEALFEPQQCLLKDPGFWEPRLSKTTRKLSDEAEKAIRLWLRSQDQAWEAGSS